MAPELQESPDELEAIQRQLDEASRLPVAERLGAYRAVNDELVRQLNELDEL